MPGLSDLSGLSELQPTGDLPRSAVLRPSPLSVAIMALLLLAIGTVGYMLVKNVYFAEARAPRTEIERRLFEARAAIEKEPRQAASYVKLGIVLSEMGDHKGAIGQFDRAKELEPTLFRAYYLAALSYREAGDLKSAEKELLTADQVLRKNINRGRSWEPVLFRLGEIYVERRQWAKAIERLEQALEMKPTGADTLVLLGRAYEGKGETDKAIDSFKRAFEFDPGNIDAKKAIARLKK